MRARPAPRRLVALKGSSTTASTVNTCNIASCVILGEASNSKPIAYRATDPAGSPPTPGSGSGGKIPLYGKLQLRKGLKTMNQVWQVRSSVTGKSPTSMPSLQATLLPRPRPSSSSPARFASATSPSPVADPLAGGPSVGEVRTKHAGRLVQAGERGPSVGEVCARRAGRFVEAGQRAV